MAASSDSFALSKSSCCGSVTSTTLSNSGLHSSSSGRLTTGTGYFNGFTSGHPGRLGKISLHKGLLLEYTQFTVQATWGETLPCCSRPRVLSPTGYFIKNDERRSRYGSPCVQIWSCPSPDQS